MRITLPKSQRNRVSLSLNYCTILPGNWNNASGTLPRRFYDNNELCLRLALKVDDNIDGRKSTCSWVHQTVPKLIISNALLPLFSPHCISVDHHSICIYILALLSRCCCCCCFDAKGVLIFSGSTRLETKKGKEREGYCRSSNSRRAYINCALCPAVLQSTLKLFSSSVRQPTGSRTDYHQHNKYVHWTFHADYQSI